MKRGAELISERDYPRILVKLRKIFNFQFCDSVVDSPDYTGKLYAKAIKCLDDEADDATAWDTIPKRRYNELRNCFLLLTQVQR